MFAGDTNISYLMNISKQTTHIFGYSFTKQSHINRSGEGASLQLGRTRRHRWGKGHMMNITNNLHTRMEVV